MAELPEWLDGIMNSELEEDNRNKNNNSDICSNELIDFVNSKSMNNEISDNRTNNKKREDSFINQFKRNYKTLQDRDLETYNNKLDYIFSKVKPHISSSIEEFSKFFNMEDMEYIDHQIVSQLKDMYKKGKIIDIGPNGIVIGKNEIIPIDKYVFSYLCGLVKEHKNIEYTDYYVELYYKIKSILIQFYKKDEYLCSDYLGNSKYMSSLTNEYIINLTRNNSKLASKDINIEFNEIHKRFISDVETMRKNEGNLKYIESVKLFLLGLGFASLDVFILGGVGLWLYNDFKNQKQKDIDYCNMLYNYYPPYYNGTNHLGRN